MNFCRPIAIAVLALLSAGSARASLETSEPTALPDTPTNSWSMAVSLYGYWVPDSRDYLNPNFTADRDWFHFEARYNYESVESASLWVGYNFSVGENLVLDFTPMLGGVFGNLTGIAPGYNLSLSYHQFSLSSQSEYVVDTGDSSNNFFYTWSELSYSPWHWLRVGYAAQRTKLYQTDLDIQRGFLVGFAYGRAELTTYVFNLGWTDPTLVLALNFSF